MFLSVVGHSDKERVIEYRERCTESMKKQFKKIL